MDKITVIITAFTRRNFLSYAIDSVLNQSYSPFEIIVAKCFEDEQMETKYGNRGIKFINFDEKKDYGERMVAAIKEATGDIIAFLEDDDMFHRDKVKGLINAYKSLPEIISVKDRVHVITENGPIEQLDSRFQIEKEPNDLLTFDFNLSSLRLSEFLQMKRLEFDGCVSTFSFRKTFLLNNADSLICNYSLDWIFGAILLECKGNMRIINERLTFYRVHQNNASAILSLDNDSILRLKNNLLKNVNGLKCLRKINSLPMARAYLSRCYLISFFPYAILFGGVSKRKMAAQLLYFVKTFSSSVKQIKWKIQSSYVAFLPRGFLIIFLSVLLYLIDKNLAFQVYTAYLKRHVVGA